MYVDIFSGFILLPPNIQIIYTKEKAALPAYALMKFVDAWILYECHDSIPTRPTSCFLEVIPCFSPVHCTHVDVRLSRCLWV